MNSAAALAETQAPAVICDVDGTLCDVRTIRHFVERPVGVPRFRANYAAFHAASRQCPPFPMVVALVRELAAADWSVIVVTGREARWAALTAEWLDSHEIPYKVLLSRAELDYRADAIVKAEMCDQIHQRYSAQLAIDDRHDILDVWARAGISTIAVTGEGALSPVTWRSDRDPSLRAIVERHTSLP